jgi:hypothetical protein
MKWKFISIQFNSFIFLHKQVKMFYEKKLTVTIAHTNDIIHTKKKFTLYPVLGIRAYY